MKQSDIIRHIERTAPLSIAAKWDTSGIQVASRRETIHHLAVCLDPTPDSIHTAIASGADMILSHHPLCMEPRFTNRLDGYHDILSNLFRADVPLYAAHTSLDANPCGPVSWLAKELRLSDTEPLPVLEVTGEYNGYACGFGMVGDLPDAVSPDVFAALLVPWIQGACIRLVGTLPDSIRRVAICPGSGSSLTDEAVELGACMLITGDLKYHPALEVPLPVLDVGHFCLEEEMMRRFAVQLQSELADVTVTFVPGHDPFQPFGRPSEHQGSSQENMQ